MSILKESQQRLLLIAYVERVEGTAQQTGLVVAIKVIVILQMAFTAARMSLPTNAAVCFNIFVLTQSNRNDGSFCPNGSTCIYCNGSSGAICCQGDDGVIIPPYTNNNPSNTAVPTQPPHTAPSTSQQSIPTVSPSQPTTAPDMQYYSTTFTYTYIVWTRITYIQSVVDSTITTTFTILSCLATDPADAAPTLSSLASSVQSSASSSAIAASPASTAGAATTTAPTAVQTGLRSVGPESLRRNWIVEAAVIFVVAIFTL
jgi:hypothetical protein